MNVRCSSTLAAICNLNLFCDSCRANTIFFSTATTNNLASYFFFFFHSIAEMVNRTKNKSNDYWVKVLVCTSMVENERNEREVQINEKQTFLKYTNTHLYLYSNRNDKEPMLILSLHNALCMIIMANKKTTKKTWNAVKYRPSIGTKHTYQNKRRMNAHSKQN